MTEVISFLSAHWLWIVAYPVIGAFLAGLFHGEPDANEFFFGVLFWPVLLVAAVLAAVAVAGALIRGIFE